MKYLDKDKIEEARKVIAKMDGLYAEISAAVKRKSDAPVTKFQLKLINAIIADANAVLGERKPLAGFVHFDEDDLPVASDISMVVAQYVEILEIVRVDNITTTGGGRWFWNDRTLTPTSAPKARR